MNPAAGAALLALCAIGSGMPAAADEFDTGEFVVHYTALATLQLTPAIADAYGIARSPNRALLNVAVLRKRAGTPGIPTAAQVSVTAVNRLGQYKPMAMRRIDEPPSIYSIGEVTVADAEVVTFEIVVIPEGSHSPIRLRLQHQFFAR